MKEAHREKYDRTAAHYERYCDEALLSEQFRKHIAEADEALKIIRLQEAHTKRVPPIPLS